MPEKIIIEIHAASEKSNPYVITCESATPSYHARKIQIAIDKMLLEDWIADGVQNIKIDESYKGRRWERRP